MFIIMLEYYAIHLYMFTQGEMNSTQEISQPFKPLPANHDNSCFFNRFISPFTNVVLNRCYWE